MEEPGLERLEGCFQIIVLWIGAGIDGVGDNSDSVLHGGGDRPPVALPLACAYSPSGSRAGNAASQRAACHGSRTSGDCEEIGTRQSPSIADVEHLTILVPGAGDRMQRHFFAKDH